MDNVGVDCIFSENGSVRIRRVKIGESWKAVSQGRQWASPQGRHVLIMLSEEEVRELLLRPDTLTWELQRGRRDLRLV